jgi:hypothetical protein
MQVSVIPLTFARPSSDRCSAGGLEVKMAAVGAGWAVSAALALAAPAAAGPAAQSATIPAATTEWSMPAQIGQFDPALGELRSIGFGLTGTLRGTIGVESLDRLPSSVDAGISSTVSLLGPGGSPAILGVAPGVAASADLAGFDGRIDFAGASGRTFAGLAATRSARTTDTVGAPGARLPTAPFIGTGRVALPVTASATASLAGPLDLAARMRAAAGAKVAVEYATASPRQPGGDVSGSFIASSFTLGMVAVAPLVAEHTAVQTRALSAQRGDWVRTVAFDRFDPSLGTLVSADIELSGKARTRLSVLNAGAGTGAYDVDRTVAFNLLRPDGTSLGSAVAQSTRSGMLDPDRGAHRFSRPFGATSTDTLVAAADLSAATPPDLALFSGLGEVSLELEALGTLLADLPSNADLLSSAVEGSVVTLSYTYLPGIDAAAAAAPEPSTLALLAWPLAVFVALLGRARQPARAVARRRRR